MSQLCVFGLGVVEINLLSMNDFIEDFEATIALGDLIFVLLYPLLLICQLARHMRQLVLNLADAEGLVGLARVITSHFA